MYSYIYVGSRKCNRPTAAKGGKRQKLKKKNKKKHHTSCSLDGENHSLCVYIVKVTGFYCRGDEYENAHRMYLRVAVCLKYRK